MDSVFQEISLLCYALVALTVIIVVLMAKVTSQLRELTRGVNTACSWIELVYRQQGVPHMSERSPEASGKADRKSVHTSIRQY